MRFSWKVLLTMLAFCLALPLLAAGPAFAECDGVPDQLQIKGEDGADHDGEPDQLRIREDQVVPETFVVTAETIGDQIPDKVQLQVRGAEGADHDQDPDQTRTGQATE